MFSSCICFEDTSYHSVREDAQKAVFTSICRLYDQFGADTLVQFNIINTPLLKEQIGHRKFFNPSSQLNVNAANDAAVFNEILNEKMRQGVSNIRRKMYITFSVSAPTVDDAVPKLARIENQISQILTSIGSKSHVLDGAERLALLNSQLNPLKPFNFDYRRDISARMVQTTKDCIAPMTLDFKPEGLADCFKTGDMWGQVLVIKKLGSELTDQALSDITELPIPLNVTWFAQPMDKAAAVAFTRQRLAWIDKEIIEEQRSAVQKGYDFSILPQELKYSKEETEDVIDNLQNKNQRLYVFTGLFYTYAPTKKQLDNQVLSIISAARQNSIEVSTYEYRQRQGFNSILPLGHNHCEISRMSTTAEVSILMPFATMELDDKGGNYYGQNKHSSNLIFCNRKLLASPMGFVCGKTGSGKGMAVKTEMTGTILSNPTDEIYIIDRAGEYTGISSRYGGVTYNFAVDSDTYLIRSIPFPSKASARMPSLPSRSMPCSPRQALRPPKQAVISVRKTSRSSRVAYRRLSSTRVNAANSRPSLKTSTTSCLNSLSLRQRPSRCVTSVLSQVPSPSLTIRATSTSSLVSWISI